ncbi:hypothetical protein [Streptococcus phocae]|uniref:Uncharacterized protein n=1 Tax=Streptococcus phocae TaxID=119224 RepID=A0A0P6S097_9STRE|nr:hypothetical protein [Streptococcus phocae]KPJ21791.1 hypothetical protein AKK44_07920 [Streptococcus phocae]
MKTYTLTEEELEELVVERMKRVKEKRTPQSLFKDVSFDDELIPINKKYPKVLKKLNRDRAYKPEKHVFNQTPKVFGVDNEISYSKITTHDVHNHIRLLVLNVFGKSQNKDILPEEHDQAVELYKELKGWFVSSYDKRLEGLVLEND